MFRVMLSSPHCHSASVRFPVYTPHMTIHQPHHYADMSCDHCNHEFDTVALKAKQGTQIICPSCGDTTTVRYSFKDSLKDFHGFLVRDPKYVSTPYLVGSIAFLVMALVVIAIFIRSH